MSAPTLLPPHHPNYAYGPAQNYPASNGYSHHQNYRSAGAYNPPPPSSSASYTLPAPSNGSSYALKSESRPEEMPPVSANAQQSSKKRQRSREPRNPDWDQFYKNGLPKEVIVIDDSPEPALAPATNGSSVRAVNGVDNRHAAKKRKRDDVGTAYDPVYQLGPDSQTPQYKASASGSTISTDRTTSAVHTTAATSLGSHSSNGQNSYEEAVQPGAKRKRTTTRLQQANEAKRLLEETSDAFTSYRPPPRPPIKAADVQVKQVADVSLTHLPS